MSTVCFVGGPFAGRQTQFQGDPPPTIDAIEAPAGANLCTFDPNEVDELRIETVHYQVHPFFLQPTFGPEDRIYFAARPEMSAKDILQELWDAYWKYQDLLK